MDQSILVTESTLTDRYQTTVPDAVRKALGLHKREKIRYTVHPDGSVVISRADEEMHDPALEQFLCFLACDIRENPHHIQAMPPALLERIEDLVGEVDVDLNAELLDKDE